MSWDRIADGLVRVTQRAFTTDQQVTYTPAGGTPVVLSGRAIFEDAHQESVLNGETVEIQTTAPKILIQLSDLAAPPAEYDLVDLLSATAVLRRFEVRNVGVDGDGGAVIDLEEIS